MSRPEKRSINGWIILDKPVGIGSTSALGRVKRLLRPEKAGHAGTLDPAASGILAIALGEATKVVPLMMDARKTYQFRVIFGAETDTDDSDGKFINISVLLPDINELHDILPQFTGTILQTPPQYSALKINGQRAYDLARSGKIADIKAREVEVYSLKIMDIVPNNIGKITQVVMEAECSKGTYIRSLARDIGRITGSYAHAAGIRRTIIGKFSLQHTISLESLEEIVHKGGNLEEVVLPVEAVLDDILVLQIPPESAVLLKKGQGVLIDRQPTSTQGFPVVCGGKLIAIGRMEAGLLKPMRVFNH